MPQPITAYLIDRRIFEPGTTTKQAAEILRRMNLQLVQVRFQLLAVRIH